MELKDRVKKYLEEQFRSIKPTEAAKDFRIRTLKELMDKVQDLRIKGIEDEEVIYNMCIESLGNFPARLKDFEEEEHKVDNAKRKISLAVACSVAVALALVIIYVVIGVTTGKWHPAWLLLLGGAFLGVIVVACLFIAKFGKAQKYGLMRLFPPVIIVLVSVYLFLLLNLVFNVPNSWFVFLAMVIVGFVFDTALAYATSFKFRHIELCVTVEIFCVLLYVMLGISITSISFWHPGWILCLGGVVCAIGMIIALIAKRNKEFNKKERAKIARKYGKEDEAYYTMWDD